MKTLQDMINKLEDTNGPLSKEYMDKIVDMHKTPTSITINSTLCDLDSLRMLAEKMGMDYQELADLCFRQGLYSITLKLVSDLLEGDNDL